MRVSIGMPFYNSESTLVDAVRSVFAQSFQDWELILVDDGSVDGSLDIAKAIDDPRVRVVSDGTNHGLHYRLNQICSLSKGEYIARMDSDDIMHPDRLARQVQFLDENRMIDLVGTGIYTIDSMTQPNGIRDINPLDTSPKSVLRQSIMPHPTVTARAEWFRNNPYDESFLRAEDYELWCRTYAASNFARLEEPLYYFREGARAPWKYLRDYLQTAHTARKVLRKYGPRSIGWASTVRLIITSYIKGETYRMATLLGMQKALIRNRSRALTDEEQKAALEGINMVMITPVPGLTYSGEVEEVCKKTA